METEMGMNLGTGVGMEMGNFLLTVGFGNLHIFSIGQEGNSLSLAQYVISDGKSEGKISYIAFIILEEHQVLVYVIVKSLQIRYYEKCHTTL